MDPSLFVGNGNDGLRVYLHEAYLNIKLHTAVKTGTRAGLEIPKPFTLNLKVKQSLKH